MKYFTLFFAGSLLLHAQPRRGGVAVALLDTDQDGALSATEWQKAPAALAKLDRDGDGKVSAAELRPQGSDRRDEAVMSRMMSFDKNGDGKLSAEELPDRMRRLMTRADSNKDGFLTREELAQAPPRGRMAGMDPVLAAVDVDRDGTLSAGEMQEAAAAIAKLDKNGDGKLTREELQAPPAGGRRPGGRRR